MAVCDQEVVLSGDVACNLRKRLARWVRRGRLGSARVGSESRGAARQSAG